MIYDAIYQRAAKRIPARSAGQVLINFYLPTDLIAVLDSAVHLNDTDRSKYIRQAIREKMSRGATR